MRSMRSMRALVGLSLLCLLLTLYPAAASAAGGTYTVRRGDTLARIAAANGTTIQALIQANGILNPDLIYTGQTLVIPDTAAPEGWGNPAPTGAAAPAPVTSFAPAASSAQITSSAPIASFAPITWSASITSSAQIISSVSIKSPAPAASPAQAAGPAASPVPAPAGGTGFVVSISKQRCYLFQKDSLTDVWPCSTGRAGSATRAGAFAVQSKIPRAYGSRWGFWMPYWLGIYWAGPTENGIHGLPFDAKTGHRDWGDKIGTPISFGCVVLQDAAAQKLYNMAYIGMPVVIRY